MEPSGFIIMAQGLDKKGIDAAERAIKDTLKKASGNLIETGVLNRALAISAIVAYEDATNESNS